MKQRERVIQAVRHQQTDFIPFQLDLTQGVYDRLCNYYNDPEFLYTVVGNHLIREKNKNHQPIDSMSYKDIWGVVWNKEQEGGDIGIIRDYVLKEPRVELFTFPEPDAELIKSKCERMSNDYSHLFKIYEIGFSCLKSLDTEGNGQPADRLHVE